MAEFIVDPAIGYRISTVNEFGGAGAARIEHKVKWKKSSDVWCVHRVERNTILDARRLHQILDICTILSFRPSVGIDPKLFQPDALATPLDPTPLPPIADAPADD